MIGVLRRTVVSDWRFDNLCGSRLQSQVVLFPVHFTTHLSAFQSGQTANLCCNCSSVGCLKCVQFQLVSAPLNPIPIAEHFRRSHSQCEHSYGQHIYMSEENNNLSPHTSSQPITSRIYQRLLYLLTNQIAHKGFWIFNWITLPLHSEDGFRTGCRNVSH